MVVNDCGGWGLCHEVKRCKLCQLNVEDQSPFNHVTLLACRITVGKSAFSACLPQQFDERRHLNGFAQSARSAPNISGDESAACWKQKLVLYYMT